MLPVITKFVGSILLSASMLTNPTTPKALSFEASAFVTNSNQIRVAINKSPEKAVTVYLRNQDQQILFQENIRKSDVNYAVKMNVDELADGVYELEIKSSEGSIRKQITLATKALKATNRVVALQ
ncbi:hypothetical protein IC229_16195 [Spirosoma sp. BT702]|uniref:Uncharacterized protein n=1 Tax=Spirosoma profusum TaxID=2771354 RepID=A0A927ANN3_9BACT|nr:hypothetical protein [Spirosoma profusum]MBD2702194.1 hypothetical protein [Spirosoma profusum]